VTQPDSTRPGRRLTLAALAAALVALAPGCCTYGNAYLLGRGPMADQPQGHYERIMPTTLVAFAPAPGQIDVIASYANGRTEATSYGQDTGRRYQVPVCWPAPDVPRVPISRDPFLEGDGISYCDGTLRWVRDSKVVAHRSLGYSGPWRGEPAPPVHLVRGGLFYAFHALLVPVAAAFDLATLPFQAVFILAFRGGSIPL
jgi:hypothetical protein